MKKNSCVLKKNCKGVMKKKTIDYTITVKGKKIIVPDIEIFECDTCKEQMFPYEAAEKIEAYKNYSGKFIVRLNPVLHKKLSEKAKKDHRSLNQEVANIIENQIAVI